MKKLIALAIVVVMCFSMLPLITLAAGGTDYYLIGYINGKDYGCEGDWQNLGEYKFVDGKLTVTFTQDSYVFVKTGDNNNWYLSNTYQNDGDATLYKNAKEKLFVPGNKEVVFTLVENSDGSLYLSFTESQSTPQPEWSSTMLKVHAKAPADWAAVYLYAWDDAGNAYESWHGTQMTADSANEGWYVAEVPNNVANIIINNGASTQTVDLSLASYTGNELWVELTDTTGGKYNATISTSAPVVLPTEYTITFDPNYEGAPAATTSTTTNGLVTLPALTRDGYTLTGWADKDGNTVTAETVYTADTTIYAQWTENKTEEEPKLDYYLIGYINGADHGCEADWENLGNYKFVDGKLTATFEKDSYVFVKTSDNAKWYLAESYCTDTSVVLMTDKSEKLFVPGGKELTFTLVVNDNGTLTLSYVAKDTSSGGNEGGNTGDEGTTTPTGNLTIHAKVPSSWETAYLYAWASEPYVAWPGSEMTAADGWYTIEIPTSYSNIIVAEKNGGEQTVDLSLAGVTETEIWVTLGEKNSEGKYEASLAKNNKGDDVTIEQKPEEEKPAEVTEVTVYAKVPEDWKNPGVWAWAGDKNAFTSWPGLSMTQGENGWWYAKIPAWCANVIINANNGSYQTADLDITESQKDIWIEVTVDGNGQAQTQIKYTSPNTGDTAIIAPVVVLMVLSMAGIAVLLAGKKKFH